MTLNISAQPDCATEDADSAIVVNFPWYGNNEWLNSFIDSIEAPFNCTNCRQADGLSKTLYQIPINAIVYDHADYPNLSNEQVEQYIRGVNKIFKDNSVLIQFYLNVQ